MANRKKIPLFAAKTLMMVVFFVAREYDILNIQPCVNVFHCPLEVETFKLTSTLAPWALTLLLAKSIQIYLQTKHID